MQNTQKAPKAGIPLLPIAFGGILAVMLLFLVFPPRFPYNWASV